MYANTPGWPADPERLEAGRRFLRARTRGRTVLVPDTDVDGLSSALLVTRVLERLGHPAPRVVLPGRGEHVHRPELQRRLAEERPDALIVVDMGSRAGPILPGVPTLVIDHHRPRGEPEGALLVTASGRAPVANTSLLAWHLARPLAPVDDLAWIAALGVVADLGAAAPFEGLADLLRQLGKEATRTAVARLNAPARAPGHRVDLAWSALLAASAPADIARGGVPEAEALDRLRREVTAEVDRCARTAPLVAGRFALFALHSGAKVHPLVAQRWTRRLSKQVVIAANAGWLPGRINFAMRTALDLDLLDLLHGYSLPPDEDVGYGHPGATGGSLPREAFFDLAERMGFARDRVVERFRLAEPVAG